MPRELSEPLLYDTDADVTDDQQTLAGHRPNALSAATPLLSDGVDHSFESRTDRGHIITPPALKQPLLSPGIVTRDISATRRRSSSAADNHSVLSSSSSSSSATYDAEFVKQAAVLQ